MTDDFDDGLVTWVCTIANTPDVPDPEEEDDLLARLRWFQIPRRHRQRVIDALFRYLDRIIADDARHLVRADGPEITGFLREAARKLLN